MVQIATAKQEGLSVGVHDGRRTPPGDTLITEIIPLKYVDVSEVPTAVQPFLHTYGNLLALTKSNSLMITDTGANIKQMMEIIHYIDQPSAVRMVTKVYILRNARAGDVVQQLQQIIQQAQQLSGHPGGAPGQPAQPMVPRFPGGQWRPRRRRRSAAAKTRSSKANR